MRFPILISPLWRPMLLAIGITPERSFVEVEDGRLHVRFGLLFDHQFSLDQVEAASTSHWPVWAGIGPRANLRGNVGLIGTYVNIVEVRFKEPQRVRLTLLPVPCKRLYVSVEDPRAFIAALRERPPARTGEEAPPAPRRRGRRNAGAG